MTTYKLTTVQHKKIIEKDCDLYGGYEYKMLNCDEDYIAFNEKREITQCRSVVLSKPEGQLYSFSLPLKTYCANLLQTYQSSAYCVNEFIEGPLIHLFYDWRKQQWEIATKRGIGGYYPISDFENNKKQEYYVRTLFCDALCCDSLKQMANLDEFSKHHCYNFILQHPKVNADLTLKKVYLINVFSLNAHTAQYVEQSEYMNWNCFHDHCILFPREVCIDDSFETYNDQYLEEMCRKNEIAGIVFYNKNSGHYGIFKRKLFLLKQRNKYICPTSLFRFLCILKLDNWKDKLPTIDNVFPRKTFRKCKEFYDAMVYELYQEYIDIFIHKNRKKENSRFAFYLAEMYSLYYLTYLGKKIPSFQLSHVKEYMQNMTPLQQYYFVCTLFRDN